MYQSMLVRIEVLLRCAALNNPSATGLRNPTMACWAMPFLKK